MALSGKLLITKHQGTFSIHKDDLFIVFIETGLKGHAKVGPV